MQLFVVRQNRPQPFGVEPQAKKNSQSPLPLGKSLHLLLDGVKGTASRAAVHGFRERCRRSGGGEIGQILHQGEGSPFGPPGRTADDVGSDAWDYGVDRRLHDHTANLAAFSAEGAAWLLPRPAVVSYDRLRFEALEPMRVSTGNANQSDGRLFTVVVESFGLGRQRKAERRICVPFERLQPLMQSIAKNGGRIKMVSEEKDATDNPIQPRTTPASPSPPPQPLSKQQNQP